MIDNTPQKPSRPDKDKLENGDPMETLHVPPPNFRERIAAAQRARTNEIRPNIEAPSASGESKNKDGNLGSIEETKPTPADFLTSSDEVAVPPVSTAPKTVPSDKEAKKPEVPAPKQ